MRVFLQTCFFEGKVKVRSILAAMKNQMNKTMEIKWKLLPQMGSRDVDA